MDPGCPKMDARDKERPINANPSTLDFSGSNTGGYVFFRNMVCYGIKY